MILLQHQLYLVLRCVPRVGGGDPDSLPLIEEPEIKETVKSTIRKANAMTQEAFAALDLSDTLEVTGL